MFGFSGKSAKHASTVDEVCRLEQERQWRDIIMIPSESICNPEAVAILSTGFGNVYAEGQAVPPLMPDAVESAPHLDRFRTWQVRLSDGRFYRGCLNADRVELLARHYVAELFAQLDGSPGACAIHANVQALSGAAANTAVYEALLQHGDSLMALDLAAGGHLTHGSEYNFSGKTFRVASYTIDPETRRLDYDAIRELALAHRPRLIVGGASAYPWDFDWERLRAIADEVGALLLADIAHLAGMVAMGHLNNPVPYAHVVSFTTHKTLCGPRGSVILTTDPAIAAKINAGVFPGLQGGPHMHSIAAIARHFEWLNHNRDSFAAMQKAVIDNTAYLASCLQEEGFSLEYGGTNVHLLLVDLKKFPVEGDNPLDGETAARLLEMAGLVVNKNMIPGDLTGGTASGVRFGMTWPTQRGISRDGIKEIAAITRFVLEKVKTFRVWVPTGEERCRGRLPYGHLDQARRRTDAIVAALRYPSMPPSPPDPPEPARLGPWAGLLLTGDKVELALDQLLTCRVTGLEPEGAADGFVLRKDGSVIDHVVAVNLGRQGREERFALLAKPERLGDVAGWLQHLSDGYFMFDSEDLQAKIDGPMLIEPLSDELARLPAVEAAARREPRATEGPLARLVSDAAECFEATKPYFVGLEQVSQAATPAPLKQYSYEPPDLGLRRTIFNDTHKAMGAKMTNFSGWEMPVQYPEGIFAEHRAVRTAAGLYDVSHMSQFEIAGGGSLQFLDILLGNCVSRLQPGEAQYTYMFYPDGRAVDDMYLYRLEWDRFMLVANAANAEEAYAWLEAAASREFAIDLEAPGKRIQGEVRIRNLRDAGKDAVVGLAFQGRASREVLRRLANDPAERAHLLRQDKNTIIRLTLGGIPVSAGSTGYTGEQVGYEIYVHPDRGVELWNLLLETGKDLGVLAAGLGARDSTRTEAGLPLFGHELEGECKLTATEAGYGFAVKFHVPFFIGRRAFMERLERGPVRTLVRLAGQGRKSVRPGHAILDSSGAAVGQVTSFAYLDDDLNYIALGCVPRDFPVEPGDSVHVARTPLAKFQAPASPASLVEVKALTRFPEDEERVAWPERHGAQGS